MFGAWTLNAVWQLIVSSFSITNLIGIGAVAVAVSMPTLPKWLPFSNLRQWAILVAVVAFGYSAVLTKGVDYGLSIKQAEWDAAVKSSIEKSKVARTDAERDLPRDVPSELSNDIYNRDNARR